MSVINVNETEEKNNIQLVKLLRVAINKAGLWESLLQSTLFVIFYLFFFTCQHIFFSNQNKFIITLQIKKINLRKQGWSTVLEYWFSSGI